MAIGNPVSYWYGTKAQYNAIQTKLEDTLYFITDEQTLYKGTVRFAEGVEQLSDVASSAPAEPSAFDKYFNTNDGKIYVYNGATWGNAYTPVEGERVGFVFPVYGWEPPKIVLDFIGILC